MNQYRVAQHRRQLTLDFLRAHDHATGRAIAAYLTQWGCGNSVSQMLLNMTRSGELARCDDVSPATYSALVERTVDSDTARRHAIAERAAARRETPQAGTPGAYVHTAGDTYKNVPAARRRAGGQGALRTRVYAGGPSYE